MSAVDAFKTYKREMELAQNFMAQPTPRALKVRIQECAWGRIKDMPTGLRSALERVVEVEQDRLLARAVEYMQDTLARQRRAVKAECDAIMQDSPT